MRARVVWAGTAVVALLGSGLATPASAAEPGVSKNEIRVGGVVSKTNPLNGPYASAFDGVQAYFDMVNSQGGVFGRKLKLVAKRDDQMFNNKQEVQALLEQDNVFAVLPVATIVSLSGVDLLVRDNVPTFGWGINDEWAGPKNLFGIAGTNCSTCSSPQLATFAKLLHKKTVGILAYNVQASTDCADTYAESFDRWPTAKVVYVTKSLSFGNSDFSVEVKQMKDKGVDFISTCMDQNGVLALAKEMKKQGLNAVQFLPNAYNAEFVKPNAEFLQGDIVNVLFTPFETRPKPKGLGQFEKWMDKAGYAKNETSAIGWLSAAEFVFGLREVGKKPTRQKVIDALNAPKNVNWNADGMLVGIHTVNHTKVTPPDELDCAALVKIMPNGTFKPTFTKPGKPFICVPDAPANIPKPVYR